MKIALADEGAEIEPVPTDVPSHNRQPKMDRLSNILKTFHEHIFDCPPEPETFVIGFTDAAKDRTAASNCRCGCWIETSVESGEGRPMSALRYE